MKYVPESLLEPAGDGGHTLRLGIVRLGRAAGKTKYSLLDERDITLVQEYAFEAKVEVDANGMGACIYAFAFDVKKGRAVGEYVHTMLWKRHRGGIAPGFKVVHINGVTVDNRLDNLALVPVGQTEVLPGNVCSTPTPSSSKGERLPHFSGDKEKCLYWVAIAQLPVDPLEESYDARERIIRNEVVISSGGRAVLNRNGEAGRLSISPQPLFYYECRYPPCTQMEQTVRQFSICGRCQEARYCGTLCQQRDWPQHKKRCHPKRQGPSLPDDGHDRSPER